ncbi:MAG: phosphatase PAP2 family protein [Candidatus Burarchaeum sp.]|nr:phosphatase PAP2 family protein [Candidatus Burarchaeum sp.]MDO8340289.1 phosphatase PAP2 family protein [Candidatus Burarchaeum sp.]
MDFLTSAIAGANNPLATAVSSFLQDPALSLLVVALAFLLMVKFKTSHASPLFLALLLAFFILDPLKNLHAVSRPCAELAAKIPCPFDASFPSGHAMIAGIFMLAATGTPPFLPFLLLGIIVSLSRVYLGIHTFPDVAAGIAVGMVLYAISERIYCAYRRAVK